MKCIAVASRPTEIPRITLLVRKQHALDVLYKDFLNRILLNPTSFNDVSFKKEI